LLLLRKGAGGMTIKSPSAERSIRRSRFVAQALYSERVTRRRLLT